MQQAAPSEIIFDFVFTALKAPPQFQLSRRRNKWSIRFGEFPPSEI